MKIEELKDEEMFCLVAPDGSVQLNTIAPEFADCVAMCELMAMAGISRPVVSLFNEGFVIIPIKLTIKQNGDENTAFKKD